MIQPPGTRFYRSFLAAMLSVALLGMSARAVGQDPVDSSVPWAHIYEGKAFYAAAHTVSNGLLVGAQSVLRGESLAAVGRASLGGALGGFVTHLGMRTIGEVPEAPILGLTVVSAGASVTRNAAHGRPLLSDVSIALPPLVVRIRRVDNRWRVRPRMSLAAAFGAVCAGLGSSDTRLDLDRTLAAGHPVFNTHHHYTRDVSFGCRGAPPSNSVALAWSGSIIIPPAGAWPVTGHRKITHESVHVGQWVRDLILVEEPLSDLALGGPDGRTGLLPAVGRFVVADLLNPSRAVDAVLVNLSGASGHNVWVNRFAEREAQAMVGGQVCGRGAFACRW